MAAASLVLWFADAFHPVLPTASTTCFQSKLTQNWPRSSKEGRPILEMSWNVCHQGSRRAGSTARRLHFSTQLPDCLRDSYQVTQSSPSAPPTLAPQLPCWAHSSDGRTRMAPNARYVAINCSLSTPARSPAGSGSPAAVIPVPQLDSSCKFANEGCWGSYATEIFIDALVQAAVQLSWLLATPNRSLKAHQVLHQLSLRTSPAQHIAEKVTLVWDPTPDR